MLLLKKELPATCGQHSKQERRLLRRLLTTCALERMHSAQVVPDTPGRLKSSRSLRPPFSKGPPYDLAGRAR